MAQKMRTKKMLFGTHLSLCAREFEIQFSKKIQNFRKKYPKKTFFRGKLKFRRFLDPFQKTLQKCCFEHFCCKNMVFRVPTTSNKTMLPLGIDKILLGTSCMAKINVPSQKYVWLAPIAGSARKFEIPHFQKKQNFRKNVKFQNCARSLRLVRKQSSKHYKTMVCHISKECVWRAILWFACAACDRCKPNKFLGRDVYFRHTRGS